MRIHARFIVAAWLLSGCGDAETPTGGSTGAGGAGGALVTGGASTGGGGASSGGSDGGGIDDLEDLLARLRADRDGTLAAESREDSGWPVRVAMGRVVVSTNLDLTEVAGDHDDWVGSPLTLDDDFAWGIVPDVAGAQYKLKNGATFVADPWSRAYGYDEFGEISALSGAPVAHLERYFQFATASLAPRTVRVWLPAGAPSHVLYAMDGQNLFDPEAFFGGWKLDVSAPQSMMIVGIDNTSARMDEYTHVVDDIGNGPIGGEGDAYAALVENEVRPLIAARYGEPTKRGVIGSSLGGLIALHIADENPTGYVFAGSMSGTLGWGSIGVHNETMIERYGARGHRAFAIYLDSGGNGTCVDSDNDGIFDDDPNASDNYCETVQLRDVLSANGYVFDVDLFHWHEPGASHDEAAWASRVARPLGIFADR